MALSETAPPSEPIVLVTGASSGIGRAVAHLLAERGDSLVLLARRQAELERVADECRRKGSPRVLVTPADVADTPIDAALAHAASHLGPVGDVVHAAGIAAYGSFDQIPPEVFARVLEVNVTGTANVARSSLHQFDAHDLVGNLVLFGSVVGRISTPQLSPYVASKWAVHGLARTLQAEQTRRGGHRISLVEPGGVDTTIYAKAASYLGVQGKPPPPVDDADKVARANVALLENPRRERSVGALNALMSLGFRPCPAVYDRVVCPLMSRLALDDQPVDDHDGNLFHAVDEPDRSHLETVERG